ncbi:hypothetical protein B0H14DRAFT_3695096 [Mycena olivaceomarginata]|nr:hypothetical protein B0H14DRAFT_3695096 [Mycena olivaceomarginata]
MALSGVPEHLLPLFQLLLAASSERVPTPNAEAPHILRASPRSPTPFTPPEPSSTASSRPKRSRRCFVCGRTRAHRLSFRSCPRTSELLAHRLVAYNSDGRLVSFDGSPLPMTRHYGGVAGHLFSRRLPSRIDQNIPHSSSSPETQSSRSPHVERPNVTAPSPHRVADPERDSHVHSPRFIPVRPPLPSLSHSELSLIIFEYLVASPPIRETLAAIIVSLNRIVREHGEEGLSQRLEPVRVRLKSTIPFFSLERLRPILPTIAL